MDRNTVSEGLLIRYDVRNGRYRPNYSRNKGIEHAMGTYTPRILRGTEFYIGPPVAPRPVETLATTAEPSDEHIETSIRSKQRDVFVIRGEESHAESDEKEGATENETEADPHFQNTELFKLYGPLYYLMAVFGMFYPSSSRFCKYGHQLSKIYGICVVVVLWANLFRLVACFTPSDGSRPGIVIKISILGWFFCGAVSALVCFWSWNSNSFSKFSRDWNHSCSEQKLPLKTRQYLKSAALCSSIFAYLLILAQLGFCLYATFGSDGMFVVDGVNLRDCPVTSGSGGVLVIIIFTLAVVFTCAAWILPLTQLYLISVAIHSLYVRFNRLLKTAINVDKNIHRNLEEFRQRHLSICHLTQTVDHVLAPYSSVVFTVNIVTLLALIGDLCLTPTRGSDERVPSAVFLTSSAFVIAVFLYSCVTISSASQAPLWTLLRYRVMSGSSENSIQMSLFLCQLTTLSSGFTLMRLYTVNKTTLIACLCVVFAYLAVLLHIMPATSASINNYGIQNETNVTLET